MSQSAGQKSILGEQRVILFIIITFLILGSLYSIATPIFEASDEGAHYPFVRHLAQGNGLPIQDPANPQDWMQEGSQPPLFYMLGALATFWVDTSDYQEFRWQNPHARIGIPGSHGNKNMFIHTARENFPYQGTVLAVRLVRFLSLLFGAASVALTYILALEIFPERKYLAMTAALFHAFNPMFLFISGSVSNDSLITLLASLALFLLVRLLKYGVGHRRLLALGLVLGLATLTKLSGLALLGLAVLTLAYLAYHERSASVFLRGSILVLIPTALISGWWYWRNLLLYNDPLGLNVMLAIAGRRPVPVDIPQLAGELEGLWTSYWGVFGGFNILAPGWIYWIFAGLTLGGLLGLGWILFGEWKVLPQRKYLGLLGIWLLLLSLALIQWTQTTFATTGRLLFPAISAISLLLALGWSRLTSWQWPGRLVLVWGGILGAIAFLLPFITIAPAYARPPLLTESELAAVPYVLDANYGGVLRLVGYNIDPQAVESGKNAWVTLYWQALAPIADDYSISLKVFGPGDRAYGQVDTYPGLGTFPTSLWVPGQAIAETYAIPVTGEIPSPSAGNIEIVVYRYPSFEKLVATDPLGRVVGRVLAGRVKLLPEAIPSYEISNPTNFTLGDKIALVGYQLQPEILASGGELELTLYWKSLAAVDEDYTVFVHLVDHAGNLWSQADGPPRGGEYPTSLWDPGETIADSHHLLLPRDMPGGEYRLEVGMYLLETLERLAVVDAQGQRVANDVAIIERWKVE